MSEEPMNLSARTKSKISIKYKYLFSYLALALVAFSMAGLILYSRAVNELQTMREQGLLERMELFADDLATQTQTLYDVADQVSTQLYYKPTFFTRNPYYEIELLMEFEKLANNSMIINEYFLLYKDDSYIFKSTRNKSSFDVFIEHYGLENDDDLLYARLNNLRSFEVLRNGSKLIFAFPVSVYGFRDESGYATLIFFVSAEKIKTRSRTLVGDMEGTINIFYDDVCIATLSSDGENVDYANIQHPGVYRQTNRTVNVVAHSYDGRFRAVLNTKQITTNLFAFAFPNTVFIIVSMALLVMACAWAGYLNYKPIKRFSEKYLTSKGVGGGNNELDSVERFIDAMLKDRDDDELSLSHQYRIIRNHILCLLLNGDSRCQSASVKPLMGIYLPGPFYCLAIIRADTMPSDSDAETLCMQVEDLAENGGRLYLAVLKDQGLFALIVSVLDEDNGIDAVDCVRVLLESQSAVEVNVSEGFVALSELPLRFSEAKVKLEPKKKKPSRHLHELVSYIEDNYKNPNMSLSLLAGQFDLSTRYISAIIKEKTQMTYIEFITDLRIKKAHELLLSGKYSVSEVCELVGYTHLPHFIKTFKRVLGITPSTQKGLLHMDKHKGERQ